LRKDEIRKCFNCGKGGHIKEEVKKVKDPTDKERGETM
jgi:Zinc knuckle